MTEEQKNSIVACIKEHIATIKTSTELKDFYESKFGFEGYYSVDESYVDYFQSGQYIKKEVEKQINIDANGFIKKIQASVGDIIWKKYQDIINGFNAETDINYVFRDLDKVSYSKFGTMQTITENRVEEMKKCYRVGAYLSVMVLTGSVLEALLKTKYPKVDDFVDMIKKAKDNGLFNDLAYREAEKLRDYRNYVHPSVQVNDPYFQPTKSNAGLFIQTLGTILEEIKNFI